MNGPSFYYETWNRILRFKSWLHLEHYCNSNFSVDYYMPSILSSYEYYIVIECQCDVVYRNVQCIAYICSVLQLTCIERIDVGEPAVISSAAPVNVDHLAHNCGSMVTSGQQSVKTVSMYCEMLFNDYGNNFSEMIVLFNFEGIGALCSRTATGLTRHLLCELYIMHLQAL